MCTYINKGSDIAVYTKARENREYQNDEFIQYQMSRYINSNAPAWRLLSFPIHNREWELPVNTK